MTRMIKDVIRGAAGLGVVAVALTLWTYDHPASRRPASNGHQRAAEHAAPVLAAFDGNSERALNAYKTFAYFFGAPALNVETNRAARPLDDTSAQLRATARVDRWLVVGFHVLAPLLCAAVWGWAGLAWYALLWALPLVTVLQPVGIGIPVGNNAEQSTIRCPLHEGLGLEPRIVVVLRNNADSPDVCAGVINCKHESSSLYAVQNRNEQWARTGP